MAIKINMEPVHPGGFIRRSVLPDELSVTKAAKLLDIGRPALSNLLNENAALSPEMALRVEMAFGVNMETLLRMQTRHDAYHVRQRADDLKVSPYTVN